MSPFRHSRFDLGLVLGVLLIVAALVYSPLAYDYLHIEYNFQPVWAMMLMLIGWTVLHIRWFDRQARFSRSSFNAGYWLWPFLLHLAAFIVFQAPSALAGIANLLPILIWLRLQQSPPRAGKLPSPVALLLFYVVMFVNLTLPGLVLMGIIVFLIVHLLVSNRIYRARATIWPTHLPPTSRGMTLIELLIVVALLSIFAVQIANMTSSLHMANERRQAWAEGLTAAEGAIERLRAGGASLDLGVHPIPEAWFEELDWRGQGVIQVEPGPSPALYQVLVWVEVPFVSVPGVHTVQLSTLMPQPLEGRPALPKEVLVQ